MANFQRNNQNVNGQVLKAVLGQPFELELWGPIDTRTNTELVVATTSSDLAISCVQGKMVPGKNVRVWKVTGLPVGRTDVVARDSGGLVWTQVTIEVQVGQSSAWTITRKQLEDGAGVVQPKYPPSPVILELIALLSEGTGGDLRRGAGSLEAPGRSGNLYEHNAGLALDIYRNSGDKTQRLQAHNLIRFFVSNRGSLGWRNMFYEHWGFAMTAPQGYEPHHDDHIHIDWMDFSTLKYEGSNKFDRSKWTEITWPLEARGGNIICTASNIASVANAWADRSAPPLTDGDIVGLYK